MSKQIIKMNKDELISFLAFNASKAIEAGCKQELKDKIDTVNKQLRENKEGVRVQDLKMLAKSIEKIVGKDNLVYQEDVFKTNHVTLGDDSSTDDNSTDDSSQENKTADKESASTEETSSKTKEEKAKEDKKAKKTSSKIFPEKLELQDGSSYLLAHDIKTMQDLCNEIAKADENEQVDKIMFAGYWTKRHLKVFGYGEGSGILSKVPDHFENNLDLATPIYISDDYTVVYFLSNLTEALYQIDPENVGEDKELGYRMRKGIEYQLYRKED